MFHDNYIQRLEIELHCHKVAMNRLKGQLTTTCTISTRMSWMTAAHDALNRCVR
jgi:hypothetical protein